MDIDLFSISLQSQFSEMNVNYYSSNLNLFLLLLCMNYFKYLAIYLNMLILGVINKKYRVAGIMHT